eukprot:c5592_g1_i1.p1 GENE.c5592_g1_i1~~c5592_g1_i1.p1  ORF type:complete len:116 (-),score=13.04 c5592_g1_i1:92-439(-)
MTANTRRRVNSSKRCREILAKEADRLGAQFVLRRSVLISRVSSNQSSALGFRRTPSIWRGLDERKASEDRSCPSPSPHLTSPPSGRLKCRELAVVLQSSCRDPQVWCWFDSVRVD